LLNRKGKAGLMNATQAHPADTPPKPPRQRSAAVLAGVLEGGIECRGEIE